MTNEQQEYFIIDEKGNALDSLRRAVNFLENTDKDPYNWKWFIIAIHHAIHSFMLVALQNTDLSGIWEEPEVRRTDGLIDLFNSNNRLISFMEAFRRIQDPVRMGGYVNSQPFRPKPYHQTSMKYLNDRLRNEFIHYRPKGWSIHNKYFIDIVRPMLEIIEFLVTDSKRCFFEEELLRQIKSDIEQIRNLFKKVDKTNLESRFKAEMTQIYHESVEEYKTIC